MKNDLNEKIQAPAEAAQPQLDDKIKAQEEPPKEAKPEQKDEKKAARVKAFGAAFLKTINSYKKKIGDKVNEVKKDDKKKNQYLIYGVGGVLGLAILIGLIKMMSGGKKPDPNLSQEEYEKIEEQDCVKYLRKYRAENKEKDKEIKQANKTIERLKSSARKNRVELDEARLVIENNKKNQIYAQYFIDNGTKAKEYEVTLFNNEYTNLTDKDYTLEVDGKAAPSSTKFKFKNPGIHNVTISLKKNITTFKKMFYECNNLAQANLSELKSWDTNDTSYMFGSCRKLKNVNTFKFYTPNVRDMKGMFIGCESLPSIDLNYFNTTLVTDMSWMFFGAKSLTSLDLSGFVTNEVEDMGSMFGATALLSSLDVSMFNTSNVKDMAAMFTAMASLTSLDLYNFDTSKVENMRLMFGASKNLKELDLSGFKTDKVKDMKQMFTSMNGLEKLNIAGFNLADNVNTEDMFEELNDGKNFKITVNSKLKQKPLEKEMKKNWTVKDLGAKQTEEKKTDAKDKAKDAGKAKEEKAKK